MSTILNTLTREEILRMMEIVTIIAGASEEEGAMERWGFKEVPPPSTGMTVYGVFLNLKRLYQALDPNNIDIHIRKDELDFTRILTRD